MRVLLLGGTAEARRLAERLAERRDLDVTLSFAGRTDIPARQPVPFRVGGFGGVAGLRAYLRREMVDLVVDATHPFAERMSSNAAKACEAESLPLARLTRSAWRAQRGDQWTSVTSLTEAVRALGHAPKRIFLTIGRLGLAAFSEAPQHRYLIRSIGTPETAGFAHAAILLDRPPFFEAAERALMERESVEILVTKNSGGRAAEAKLAAARDLGIPVVMIERSALSPYGPEFIDPDEVVAWIGVRQAERGV